MPVPRNSSCLHGGIETEEWFASKIEGHRCYVQKTTCTRGPACGIKAKRRRTYNGFANAMVQHMWHVRSGQEDETGVGWISNFYGRAQRIVFGWRRVDSDWRNMRPVEAVERCDDWVFRFELPNSSLGRPLSYFSAATSWEDQLTTIGKLKRLTAVK